jgi:hypothetical protein
MKQKLVDLINVIFGFRKFLAWVALFLVAIIFRLKAYIDGGQFVDLMKSTFMGFVAGNGVEHIMTTVKEYINAKGQPVGPAPASGDDLITADEETPKAGS